MIRPDQDHPDAGRDAAITVAFSDRLLAEAVRALEQDGGKVIDAQANARAVEAGGSFEQRLVVRARSLPVSDQLDHALQRARRVIGLILAGGMVLAAVAGASAAKASLATAPDRPVNVFWALGGVLGIQTLLLAAWVALMFKGPGALAGASLGGAVMALGRRLASRLHKATVDTAAIEAVGVVYTRSSIGRWTLSAMSHGLWGAFNAACLLLVIVLLSVRHYTFTWQTTILSSGSYERLTAVLAYVPDLLGFPAPTPEQISAAQWPPDPRLADEARQEWSGLLIGCIVAYGLGPRLLLLGYCLGRRRLGQRRFRLDLTRPGYLRLRPVLQPRRAKLGVIDPDTGQPEVGEDADEADAAVETTAGTGAPVIVALEIEAPASRWPPRVDGVAFNDAGFVDSRQDRQRVLSLLSGLAEKPLMTVAVCGLTTTPDRGIGAFLGQVQRATGAPLALVLTGGEAIRRRGDAAHVADRVEDWRRLARTLGVPPQRVLELDLDHLTDASVGGLGRLVGVTGATTTAPRRIEPAFELIADHVDQWPGAPDAKQQARLHEEIALLYRRELPSWKALLRVPAELKGDLTAPLRSGAESVVALLPQRLRVRPRWLASGAAAGALGCVAASALLSPVAIGALPIWAALGAAVAGVAGTYGPKKAAAPAEDPPALSGRGDAVRAAALFALLLELQGRDEAAITRILDQVICDDDDLDAATAEQVGAWLDGLRHHLDLALASEAGS